MFTFLHLAFRYAQCMFTSWFLTENEFFTTELNMVVVVLYFNLGRFQKNDINTDKNYVFIGTSI